MTRQKLTDQYFSTDDVASLLGLSSQTIRGYIKMGWLKAFRLPKAYLISDRSLQKFIRSRDKK